MSQSAPVLSVIIPSYNSKRIIKNCLDSLKMQRTELQFEVVVADSSDDGTDELIHAEYPWVRLHRLHGRTYPGPTRNAAVQRSRGSILAFLDADCTADSNWVERIVKAHQKGFRVVGGAVLNGTPGSYVGTAEYISEFSEYSPHRRGRECRMIPTCNLSLRRELFDTAGGFLYINTGNNPQPSEDMLLCNRLRELGHVICFDPEIRIHHHNRTGFLPYLKNQYALGFGSAVSRRLIRTRGSILVKVVVFQPLIPALKMLILSGRMARYGIKHLLSFFIHIPLVFWGSCYYTKGFFRGSRVPIDSSQGSYGAAVKPTTSEKKEAVL